ncbi:cation:proton antiporter [Flavobacterium sp. MFBS3-15]|uniref:cation:proton antiporter n=1 Tax=Flavobacterium sp. MFBS3-15 TaxID=2989816 RepID=UPI002236B209|nr:cation:proton antiporter [Flavobacterium sp. MFBS3-15]MCW4467642.1 cation:proton antiporter [Flavobacterium sp. MFBS3-15]
MAKAIPQKRESLFYNDGMTSKIFTGIVALSFVILILVILLRRLRQPYFVAYILSGILLGPEVFGIIAKGDYIGELGELGIILLMFFIGAEINLPSLARNFEKPLLAALTQLLLSLALMWGVGYYLNWSYTTIILTGFIISLSSSAIILQYLSRNGEINSSLGLITCGVLLVQDILIVPMMLMLNFMAHGSVEPFELVKVTLGATLTVAFLRAAFIKKLVKIPFKRDILGDHDLQVFIGFALCFGMAWVTHWFGLSAALGAFAAGIVIGQDKATRWLDRSLVPFRVFFLTFFFISIGLQIQLTFIRENIGTLLFVAFSVLLINSLINALVFRVTGHSWRDSMYAGALLSQIGEFSFLLMTIAAELKLVGSYTYQITLAVIAMTMIFTTIWIAIIQKFIYKMDSTV